MFIDLGIRQSGTVLWSQNVVITNPLPLMMASRKSEGDLVHGARHKLLGLLVKSYVQSKLGVFATVLKCLFVTIFMRSGETII